MGIYSCYLYKATVGNYDALLNQYIYHFTDHLGNIRLSYSDTNKDRVIQPRQYKALICTFSPAGNVCYQGWKPGEIVENNNYYPFGLLHNYTITTQNPYQYKYNGKELQETGMYDYGARMYMPDLGRWGVVDPLAESYRRWSPYHYAMNNPVKFTDPDGMGSYDENGEWHSEMEDYWNYHGYANGPTQNSYSSYSSLMNNGGSDPDSGGGSSALNIIINFIRADKEGLGNFINSEFAENGWHIIDATNLVDALSKLTSYLGDSQADNIYINAHGLVGKRYTFDENGNAIRNRTTGEYIFADDTGFYTNLDTEKIYGTDIQQYISDKNKLPSDKLSSIDSLIGIGKYVKEGKNLIMGSCFSANDVLFGTGLSSIIESRDIFVNRDFSSLWPIKGKIGFQEFIGYNQTSQKYYDYGWVSYRNGTATQTNFNIIMTKYGVKTIK